MPECRHDVIVLLHVLGHSTREAAGIMGITPAGVRSAARFARHRLQRALGLEQGPSGDEGGTDR
ncbi:RNA polymerase sigma factor [Streptomyces sp. NPDC008001]|uniref:RNA polymerase sigma factor n=1 Tax=Streptomyces sp. NPDC008001 TaxID=3364804 RepID=UPI0036EC7FC9